MPIFLPFLKPSIANEKLGIRAWSMKRGVWGPSGAGFSDSSYQAGGVGRTWSLRCFLALRRASLSMGAPVNWSGDSGSGRLDEEGASDDVEAMIAEKWRCWSRSRG